VPVASDVHVLPATLSPPLRRAQHHSSTPPAPPVSSAIPHYLDAARGEGLFKVALNPANVHLSGVFVACEWCGQREHLGCCLGRVWRAMSSSRCSRDPLAPPSSSAQTTRAAAIDQVSSRTQPRHQLSARTPTTHTHRSALATAAARARVCLTVLACPLQVRRRREQGRTMLQGSLDPLSSCSSTRDCISCATSGARLGAPLLPR
jgi:hypothetical protein